MNVPYGLCILSDLHIDGPEYGIHYTFDKPDSKGHLKRLETLLRKYIHRGYYIVLNGDVFDFYCSMFPNSLCFTDSQIWDAKYNKYTGFINFLSKRLVDKNTLPKHHRRIFYIKGNHEGDIFSNIETPFKGKVWDSVDFKCFGNLIHIQHSYNFKNNEIYKYAPSISSPIVSKLLNSLEGEIDSTTLRCMEYAQKSNYNITILGDSHTPKLLKGCDDRIYINTGSCVIDPVYDKYLLSEEGYYNKDFGMFEGSQISKRLISIQDNKILHYDKFKRLILEHNTPFLTVSTMKASNGRIKQRVYF